MFAAIYARRSNEQHVSEDAKSITRQVTRAREMAAKEGWECPDQYVFVDDGISGFESGLRPGLRRLLAACPPKAGERSFDLVIVSEQSRLVRNTFEAGPIFDAFLRADIRVFSYLNGEIRFRTIPEKMMVMMGAGMDEAPVSQTRSRTTDAMLLKARRGHVTGGKVFGYENVVIRGPDGRKSHVDRRLSVSTLFDGAVVIETDGRIA